MEIRIPTKIPGVFVTWAELLPRPGLAVDIADAHAAGWRVSWNDPDGERWSHWFRFATKRDAGLAADALYRAGVTYEDIAAMPLDDPWEHDQTMLEGLLW